MPPPSHAKDARRRGEDVRSSLTFPPVADPDPRLQEITLGQLLSMQAGLERQSGPNYGRWVASDNWVRAALAVPADAPTTD